MSALSNAAEPDPFLGPIPSKLATLIATTTKTIATSPPPTVLRKRHLATSPATTAKLIVVLSMVGRLETKSS